MSPRDLRFARTRCRAHTRARRETTPTCIGSFNSIWGLQGAAPFAFEALKAQIARSRRDLENVPRNSGLKPSLSRIRYRAAARAGRDTTPTRIGSFNSIWGLQEADPSAFEALKAQIARSRRDLENVPRNSGLIARSPRDLKSLPFNLHLKVSFVRIWSRADASTGRGHPS